MRPMLATPTSTPGVPPVGDEWVHEVKWDGIRALAGPASSGQVRLHNRNEVDVTIAWPDLVTGGGLPADTVVDGEIVTVGADGRPSFQDLSHRFHVRDAGRAAQLAGVHPAQLMVFDVVRLAGEDTTPLPWHERRTLLESLDLPPRWQVSPTHDDGDELAEVTREAGLEGVMSKRRTSPYRAGVRSPDWVKVPHRTEIVAVIGGWSEDRENPGRLGSLWVGWPDDEETFDQTGTLYALGRVGSGLPLAERDALVGVLHDLGRPTMPFESLPPTPDVTRSHWVEPVLCVQVRYLGRTDGGTLRQPVLRRLRPDVTPLAAPTAPVIG